MGFLDDYKAGNKPGAGLPDQKDVQGVSAESLAEQKAPSAVAPAQPETYPESLITPAEVVTPAEPETQPNAPASEPIEDVKDYEAVSVVAASEIGQPIAAAAETDNSENSAVSSPEIAQPGIDPAE